MNTEITHNQNIAISIGVRLCKAREQFGLSQQAVAERLCLKVSIIRNIEEDRAPADLALTFLNGYIRSYAKLVHVPESELLPVAEKQVSCRITKAAQMRSFSFYNRRDSWLMNFTWVLLSIMVSLTGIWWWQNYKAQKEEIIAMTINSSSKLSKLSNNALSMPLDNYITSSASEMQLPEWIPPSIISQNQQQIAQIPIQSQNDLSTFLQSNVDITSKALTLSATNDNRRRLLLDKVEVNTLPINLHALEINFLADCWLEVTDATDKKLFTGLQRKNDNLFLTGKIPYKLKIGAPAAVQVQFQGKPIDLSYFIKAHQIARLILSSEQSAEQ